MRSHLHDDSVMRRDEVFHRTGIELSPCPFCGSRVIGIFMSKYPYATCLSCKSDGPLAEQGDHYTGARLIEAAQMWNNRPSDK